MLYIQKTNYMPITWSDDENVRNGSHVARDAQKGSRFGWSDGRTLDEADTTSIIQKTRDNDVIRGIAIAIGNRKLN